MDEMKLDFFAGVEYKNQIYFSEYSNTNGLFAIDIENQKIRFLKLFDQERIIPNLHRAAFLYKNEAWFIPQAAEYIANINLETLDIIYYEVPFHTKENKINSENTCIYITGHIFGEKYLCLIPYDIDTVLIIDMETHKMYPFFNAVNLGETVTDGVIISDELYLFPKKGKNCIKINLITKSRELLKWNFKERAFGTVQLIRNKLWFCPVEEKYILCVDIINNKKKKLIIPNPNDEYWGMLQIADQILIFPYKAQNFILIDVKSFDVNLYPVDKREELFGNAPNIVSQVSSTEKNIITMGLCGCVVFLNKKNFVIPLKIDTRVFCDQLHGYLSENGYLRRLIEKWDFTELANMIGIDENTMHRNLEYFLRLDEIIHLLPYRCIDNTGTYGMVGKQIWQQVLNGSNRGK